MTIHNKTEPIHQVSESNPYHKIDDVTNKITLNVSLKKMIVIKCVYEYLFQQFYKMQVK